MPTLTSIPASDESRQGLNKPIVVVQRQLQAHLQIAEHQHDWSQFIYASQGALAVKTVQHKYIVPPEQGVLIAPEVKHEVSTLTPAKLVSFYFDSSQLSCYQDCKLVKVCHFHKALIQQAANISKKYQWSSSDGRLLRLIRDRLLIAPEVDLQLPYPCEPRLVSIYQQLLKQPNLGYSLRQWGEVVGASSRTLSRLFKQDTGLSYQQWRLRLMVQIAIGELAKGESVSNVALYLGYESTSAFVHMFKQQMGQTPGVFNNTS